jgi:hypothetical protein
MFWKKKPVTKEPSMPKVEKLPGPKGIPELVGRHLVVELKQNPDWVWKLKGVVRPRSDGKDRFDFRVFDETQVAGTKVIVKDYNSLNEHPDLILYQGWFDKKSMKVQIEEKKPA